MKKAKFFLVAISVLGIAGAALAYQAKISQQLYFPSSGGCTLAPTNVTYQTVLSGTATPYDTFSHSGACGITNVTLSVVDAE